MGKPLWKIVNFSTFWTSCFYSLQRRFFVLEYRKRHFPGLYCLKRKLEKWPFLDQYQYLWKKTVNFLRFWTSCFYILDRRFFVLEYPKRHFPGLYCLKKKNWKNGHFWTNTIDIFLNGLTHGLGPKMTIFPTFFF